MWTCHTVCSIMEILGLEAQGSKQNQPQIDHPSQGFVEPGEDANSL